MKDEILIPTQWDELTRLQFAGVAEKLMDSAGKNSAQLTRLQILEVITGSTIVSPEHQRAGCSQKLAELTQFAFNVSINEDIAVMLSPALQSTLKWCLPEEIDHKPFIDELLPVKNLLNPSINFNLNISKNLMPEIFINGVSFKGPVFTVDKYGVLTTDITAGEYLDASEYLKIYGQTGDLIYLANIASCFYRRNRANYNTFEAQDNAALFGDCSPKFLKAVWLMLISWHHYFTVHPMFGILFSDDKQKSNEKISIGSSELIYSLSKEGFGSISEVSHMRIDDFFAIQVKGIKDTVNSLRGIKKNDSEIARDLKMPLESILKL